MQLAADLTVTQVTRVNWLRAKARKTRWEEEVVILQHEMTWTQMWFEHQMIKWKGRMEAANLASKMGHHAYAAKQVRIWSEFGQHARTEFGKVKKIVTK